MRPEKKRHPILTFLLLSFIFAIGLAIYMYPYIADKWNAYRNSQLIAKYTAQASDEEAVPNEEKARLSDEYNRRFLPGQGVVTDVESLADPEYEALPGGDIIGYIEIPKITILCPIFHYSTEAVLDKGIGHVHGSSLPVGGESTHSVLTGHRGLPESKLFTDLDQLEEGDRFYISSAGRDMAYEVKDVRVVLPEEVSSLVIEEGRDLVTLVTCTPYGVNTHRLLITGERTEFDKERYAEEAAQGQILQAQSKITPINAMIAGFVLFMLIVGVFVFVSNRKSRRERKEQG